MNIIIIMILITFVSLIYLESIKQKKLKIILNKTKPIIAIAYFNENNIKGTVEFIESIRSNRIKIIINLKGLKPNFKHGFHVHEAGDLSDKCISMCAHFNPFNQIHGCPGISKRHVGDLGNIQTDSIGNAKYIFYDNIISLKGQTNIIGRGLIIHADTDDCGLGKKPDSLITGNAGKRIACSIIGYSKKNFI